MNNVRIRSDLDCWNLDGLEFFRKPTSKGSIQVTNIKEDISGLNRMEILSKADQFGVTIVLCLRSKSRVIQRVEIRRDSNKISNNHTWETNTQFVDMAIDEDRLFGLIRHNDKHYIKMYRVIPDRLLSQQDWEWSIGPHYLTELSRIRITSLKKSKIAYVGPCRDGLFLSIELDSGQVTPLKAHFPNGEPGLGPELDFCVDPESHSLFIADTGHHRVVEVNCSTGLTKTICGVGRPGDAREGELATRAALNSPRSIALYRHRALIRQGLLDSQSISFIQSDPDGVKPRTLLVADSANFPVKKIVDLAFFASQALSLPDEPFLYTLLGSGQNLKGKPQKISDKHRQDLRQLPISPPTDLLIDSEGDLLIYSRSSQTNILLRPSTAMSMELIKSRASDAHTTDP